MYNINNEFALKVRDPSLMDPRQRRHLMIARLLDINI